jgi:acetoin utilization deacetylase AcuC-like enzyme
MKVFYRPEQVATSHQPSPSALKPRLVIQDWLTDEKINMEICSFEPVDADIISFAHDTDFVRAVLACEVDNGFGTRSVDVAASLPYTTGPMVAAAEYALLHRQVVCSPTSGFHHAEYAHGMAYCSFNGLMVTAIAMHKAALAHKVGIIDCDAHYGNGTQHIMNRLDIDWIEHHTLGAHFHDSVDARNGKFEAWLESAIDACQDCDLILYQAGADPHIDDPLGGILTTAQMSWRDRTFFERLGHLPMVWNLAGGYQLAPGVTQAQKREPVLALHRETARLHTAILG